MGSSQRSSRDSEKKAPQPGPTRGAGIWPVLLLGLLAMAFWAQQQNPGGPPDKISYSTFRQEVRQGKVTEVVLHDKRITGKYQGQGPDEPGFWVVRPSGLIEQDLIPLLDEFAVQYSATQPSQLSGVLSMFVFLIVMFAVLMAMMRRANPAERAMSFGKSRARQYVERDTKITFQDVAGIDEPKQELQEIVEYLQTPEKFRRLGGKIPKGVLLVGAPGTGKTLLAKAVAGEAKVPFFSMSGSDFVELFVGVGASRVRDLFRQAEQHSPCIVFIDELDALGKARGNSMMGGSHDEREQTLNQLLVEMDGFDSSLGVILVAATNRPEILDPALLRPGRFDRQVMIPPPDIKGREQILRVHAESIAIDPALKQDLRRIAARTPGFVGADLANVCNEAALLAARKGHEHVLYEDFDEAIDRVAVGLERKSQVMSEQEKRITAYHEAGHAVVAARCPKADPVHKISIIPRGFAGGYTQFLPQEDRHLYTVGMLRDLMAGMMGGRAAELLVFEEVSTGATNDIRQVTEVARAMVTEHGMSATLGPLNYHGGRRSDAFGMPLFGGAATSDETMRRIDDEVRVLVEEAAARALAILTERRDDLAKVAERLLETEVLEQEEFYELIGLPVPRPAGEASDAEEPVDDAAGGSDSDAGPGQPQGSTESSSGS